MGGTYAELPVVVLNYLELIERFISIMGELDSSNPESKMFQNKIAMYLEKIDTEMNKVSNE